MLKLTFQKSDEKTDSEESIDLQVARSESKTASVSYPTVLHEVNGPYIFVNKNLNIAPGEGKIPLSLATEPDCEALIFPKEYSTGKNHFNEPREVAITLSKYFHSRLESCDDRWAQNPQYISYFLDLLEREFVKNSVNFAERKQF